ncbi:transposase [Ancylomarina sp. 16SWW S1-10-2]|nr:transposase [Ancylomarina sp. 16SWW S1-10-2]MRT91728.1 transposase [Ancylomarina sp. 16SWW S1-10-2]
MHLSAIGEQAKFYWEEIPNHFPHIELGEFIIMPNHIHGIIGIVGEPQIKERTRHVVSQRGEDQRGEDQRGEINLERSKYHTDTTCRVPTKKNQFGKTIAGSLSAILGQFKSTLTRWSRKNGHENFAWQGRFHDRIIRDDRAFQNISNYIKNNPGNWDKDKFK